VIKSTVFNGAFFVTVFLLFLCRIMEVQLISAITISLLHGFIPSHWLPLIALSKSRKWSNQELFKYASIASISHALGTLIIGAIIFSITHYTLSNPSQTQSFLTQNENFEKMGSVVLFLLGIWFLYKHYKHKHFHVKIQNDSKWIFGSIIFAMFLSPCMEIVSYFFTMAPLGWTAFFALSAGYLITTWASVLTGVFIVHKGMKRFDSHKWEHQAGIFSSLLLIISALLMWL